MGHDEDNDGFDDACDNCPTYATLAKPTATATGLGISATARTLWCRAFWPSTPCSTTRVRGPSSGAPGTTGATRWWGRTQTVKGNYLHAQSLPNDPYAVEATFTLNPSAPSSLIGPAYFSRGRTLAGSMGSTPWSVSYERDTGEVSFYRINGESTWRKLTNTFVSNPGSTSGWHKLHVYYDGSSAVCHYTNEGGAHASVQIDQDELWNDMSGKTGLRVFNENAHFSSFVAYQ